MLPFINEFLKSMASALCSMLVASIPLSIYFFSRMDGGSVNILLLEALRYVPGIFVAQIFYGFYYYIIGIAVFRLIIKNRKTNTIKHHFPLFGINSQYNFTRNVNMYAGWSQAYRPVIFKDIIPTSIYEVTDKNLKDAYGYNMEAGVRGNWKFLSWDISYFQLKYQNRLGTLAQTNAANEEMIFKTNIGDSMTKGLELFTQTLGRY